MEAVTQQPNSMERLKGQFRLYLSVVLIVTISELIGTHQFTIGKGLVVIYPMLFALVLGILFGPNLIGFIKKKEAKKASTLVLVAIAPFMAKIGILAGANLSTIIEAGPVLAFQELGHIGTILLALPVALMLGLKKEAIGATSSTCRDKDYGLIVSLYGGESPEARGTLSIYVIGFLVGTVYLGLLASMTASTGIFHPLALAMACGIGSGAMMAAASNTLAAIYPDYADQIIALAGASDLLSAIIGIYFTLFISIPITKKLYFFLEPRISPKPRKLSQHTTNTKVV